ncbi:MAG: hypothetical protein N3F07_02525 [Candidatus Micrarchaeota archaeon]|nr:hypothetical protein [Candidatus Micrarchaeota archaeon]
MVLMRLAAIKISKAPWRLIALRAIFALAAGAALLLALIYAEYAAHELGHVVFGAIGSFYHTGKLPVFQISGWEKCALIDFVLCPQQTKIVEGVPTVMFMLGGPAFVILSSSAIAYALYRKHGRRIYLAFALLYAIREASANVICGTDNPSNEPMAICQALPFMEIAELAKALALLTAFALVAQEAKSRIKAQ